MIKVHMIKFLQDVLLLHCKKKYPAQVDFDFGQVYVVWWLSYSQVGEKVNVEPWAISETFQELLSKLFYVFFVSNDTVQSRMYTNGGTHYQIKVLILHSCVITPNTLSP